MKVGIVGLPNVGKSTLFNALLKRQQALVANYPFATIEPNVGVVEVPDERLVKLSEISKSGKIVYATVEFVDIAGLVKGASTGAGLGNKFLSHIREVDLIVNLMRDFKDNDIVKEGSIDPDSDYEVVKSELILKDLETVEKQKNSRTQGKKTVISEKLKLFYELLYDGLNSGKRADEILTSEELVEVKDLCLLSAKRELKVFNVSEDDPRLRGGSGELVISAKIEAEVAELGETEAKEYLAALGITDSGLNRLIRAAYKELGLISFLTTGEMESRAWTIHRGTKAPQAAGVIHTDFEKKFIKAKVCDYLKFAESGGWKLASEAGKVRMEGREYEMRDGDVVEFMIGS